MYGLELLTERRYIECSGLLSILKRKGVLPVGVAKFPVPTILFMLGSTLFNNVNFRPEVNTYKRVIFIFGLIL